MSNFSNFPLYNNLLSEIKTKRDLTPKQKDDFLKKIQELDDIGMENIYVLIRLYYIEESGGDATCDLPYSGTCVRKNIKFDLELLPIKLRQILYKFVNMHIDSNQ